MTTYTVKIDSDYSSLGEDATQEMLDGYAQNLARKLAADFSVSVEVEQTLGGRGQCVGPDDDIAERIHEAVRDIQGGDGWVDLLPESADDDHGRLCDYRTGEVIGPATADQKARSIESAERDGGRGVIDVAGRFCYVES